MPPIHPSPTLDKAGKLRIQQIIGAIRYYNQAVNKNLLVALSKFAQQQASPTEDTNSDILQLLYYLATYPNNCITYRDSNMVLAGHVDAGYLNIS